MKEYSSLTERSVNNRMALLLSTKEYINGNESIEEAVKKLEDMFIKESKIEDDYSHKISYWLDKIELLSHVMRMKKLENHQLDAVYLLSKMVDYVNKVKEIIKEKSGEE